MSKAAPTSDDELVAWFTALTAGRSAEEVASIKKFVEDSFPTGDGSAERLARRDRHAELWRKSEDLVLNLDAQAQIVDMLLSETLAGDDIHVEMIKRRVKLPDTYDLHAFPSAYRDALMYATKHLRDLAGLMRKAHEES